MRRLFLLVVLQITFLFNAACNAVTLGSINIILKANLIEKGCNISVGGQEQTVNLGNWSGTYFNVPGKKSNKIPFAINIEDCAAVSDIGITLYGISNSLDKRLLSTTLGSSLAILVTNDNGNELSVGTQFVYNISNIITGGKATLKFNAQYKSMLVPVATGDANSDAVLAIDYL